MVSHYRDENIPLIRDFWFSFITFVNFVWKNKKAQHCRPMARIFRSHSSLTNQVLCNIMMRLWNMLNWNQLLCISVSYSHNKFDNFSIKLRYFPTNLLTCDELRFSTFISSNLLRILDCASRQNHRHKRVHGQ